MIIELVLAIILSLYAALELTWVALLTLLKIIYIPIQIWATDVATDVATGVAADVATGIYIRPKS